MISDSYSHVKIYSDGDHIVIENVTEGTEICVYSVSGNVIKTHVATKVIVRIAAPKDAIHIVRIGEETAKIRH